MLGRKTIQKPLCSAIAEDVIRIRSTFARRLVLIWLAIPILAFYVLHDAITAIWDGLQDWALDVSAAWRHKEE